MAAKDVDGLSPSSAGLLALGLNGLRPCTPMGIMRLIEETGVELRGAEATVVGTSNLVGKPVARLLQQAEATVTQCHIHTVDVAAACRRADILVVAAACRAWSAATGSSPAPSSSTSASTAPRTASSATSRSTRPSTSPASSRPSRAAWGR